MKTIFLSALIALAIPVPLAPAAPTNPPPDFSRDRVLYVVGYSHLDTQWRWSYPQVIRSFIPATVHQNEPLFENYPHYVFNWTGANRYRMIQEYYPEDFAKIRRWVADGRWWPAGSSWEENDPNLPSAESLIRQLLFGQRYFKKEFGTESCEYTLPDSFGFPASLPSVLAHCGLRGFVTQKLTWGSAVGIPFNVGAWIGPDGESVIAALNPGPYDKPITNNLSLSEAWKERLDRNGARTGLFVDYLYYGVGDRGGAPDKKSVQILEASLASNGPVHVVSARADQLFRDLTDAQKAQLPKYQGDLLLTYHAPGTYTSQAYMKRWHRGNERLADAAERASVAAHLLGAAPYPREKLQRAWGLLLGGEFHDILPGTCVPKAYEYAWNDQIIALNSFAEVLSDAVGAVAGGLDTRADGAPLVVFNPLAIAREDVVEAELELPGANAVQVFDGANQPVPTQLLSAGDGKCHFLFLAKAPPVGFAVFSVRPAGNNAATPGLEVTDRSLENSRYRVTLNDAGDVASVFDKSAARELLAEPARLAFLTENPPRTPAWDMEWSDRTNAPRSYLGGPAKIRVVERGPVRVAIEVERETENSVFIQTIRLAAGGAGERVEVANRIDWQSKACSLKAVFPLTVSNALATYNLDLGKVLRATNEPKKYEVPHHDWFDLTDASGRYGVSILSPAKYGSDKPADNTVRLTLLYTPGTRRNYTEQRTQDWGRHDFVYGIYGHAGGWSDGKSDWQAERLGQPLLAFRTAPHAGALGRSFSLVQLDSDDVAVRAIKLAEDDDQVIVRLQELGGAGAKSVKLSAATTIGKATEVTGLEKPLRSLPAGGELKLDFKPYQIRSLALSLHSGPARLAPPKSEPVKLPFNLDVFSFSDAKEDGDCDGMGATIPAEMIGDAVASEGVAFKIGPRTKGKVNAVSCAGQKISLPRGNFNRLYLLALAVNGDADGAFTIDGRATPLHLQDWTGYIGQWENRVFEGTVPELTYGFTNRVTSLTPGYIKRDPLAWFCSHRHLADGKDAYYSYSYIFKYGLDLPPGAKTLTLPDNPRIRVVAATVARDDHDLTRPAWPLYDDFTGRQPVELRGEGDGPSAINAAP